MKLALIALCVLLGAQDAVPTKEPQQESPEAKPVEEVRAVGAAAEAEAAAAAAAAAAGAAAAAAAAGAENAPSASETTPELVESVHKGLEFLKSIQNADGSFGRGRYGRHVGITALAALAFMADGSVPSRGEYGEQVSKALEFVLNGATESGLLAAEATHAPMYGHGFAALFLGEVYGMNGDDPRVRDTLVRAIALIVNSQNEEGGWRYNPVPYEADVSVTICQVMALRSARNAGIKVPKETIDAAVRYVRLCQNEDGGFRYMALPGSSAWPRTAAGVATLFYAGIYEDDGIQRGLEYVQRQEPSGQGGPGAQAHYFYGQYYSAQAMYLAGGLYWDGWWPKARDELIALQDGAGAWKDHQAGDAYATAMSLIVLQMPKRYLPIFQR